MLNIKDIIYYKALKYIEKRNIEKAFSENSSPNFKANYELLAVCQSIHFYIPKIDCLIDVGAHKGMFSNAFTSLIDTKQIISVEPNKKLINHILENNKGVKVTIESVGLSNKEGEFSYFEHEDPTMNSIVESDKKVLKEKFPYDNPDKLIETKIPVSTLNMLAKKSSLNPNDTVFLKIDTQGNELDILKGSEEVLPQIKGCLVEHMFVDAYHSNYSFKDLIDFMASKGFVLAGVPAIIKRQTAELSSADFLFIK